jgi:hypothetical protein
MSDLALLGLGLLIFATIGMVQCESIGPPIALATILVTTTFMIQHHRIREPDRRPAWWFDFVLYAGSIALASRLVMFTRDHFSIWRWF